MPPINPLLLNLDIRSTDKLITIRENGNCDSNFIITHFIKQIFSDKNKLCLVLLHNSLGHYQSIGKRLGYDFNKKIEDGFVRTIEPLKDIVDYMGDKGVYFNDNKEGIVRDLYFTIKSSIENLIVDSTDKIYVIIDDISHLLDLGVDLSNILTFTNYCMSLTTSNNNNINFVINTHVCGKIDGIISNNLNYLSDIVIEVSPLKTGLSSEVTGVIIVKRDESKKFYHFKAFDRGVKTFHPGESLYNLYK